ncbi:MAG TPA: patatin-like phospholipase family protein, partial [Caulobacteraceae bacterium]
MRRRANNDTLKAALADLFEAGAGGRDSAVSWFTLAGGETLFHAGQAADTLYLLRSGRLGVFRKEEGHDPQFLGVVRPGEPAGEMSMLAGTAHTSTVVALRDSEIAAMPRDAFMAAVQKHPEVMIELARVAILRARERTVSGAAPSVFGFVSMRGRRIRPFVDQVVAGVEGLGFTIHVMDSGAARSTLEQRSQIEDGHDYVLYVAEGDEPAWAAQCARQADRLFLVADAGDPAGPRARPLEEGALGRNRLVDLILVRDPGQPRPYGTRRWIDGLSPARWFHVREAVREDAERMARTLTGASVGLVLSGGGARAFAHIGAITALREAKTPFDFVGGSSMGGIISAGLALGWDQHEMDQRIRKAFVESSPLDDIAFPILAMTRGRKVAQRLAEHFGDAEIEDLALPYFCVSTDLTSGSYRVHRLGLLRRALRASIALPGIMPPVVEDGCVLVDGAVVKNFPADLMRAAHAGPVVGVDVSRALGVSAEAVDHDSNLWRWLISGEWRQGP